MRDALVVGINTYQALPNLKAPATDAEAIADRLQTDGEFRIHRLPEVIQSGKPAIGQKTQVSLRDLETALISLFKPKGSNIPQTALFYFSGHGIQREAGIREGYLALSDSQPEKGFYGLSLFWLRRLLQESPVRQRIVILDCCHSGELLNFLEADPGAYAGTDRLFMAASREYETAFESLDSPYSVFTQAILEGLDPNRVEARTITNHSLTDYVNHALKGEIQQPLFESSGSEIILTRQTGTARPVPLLKSTDICPYRGLECFDETSAEYFFGRENLTAKLVHQLKSEHVVAVIGASGIGKSSLVRAGLISQLRQELTPEGDRRWRIKLLTPAENPLKSLAAAFIDAESTALERAEQLRRAENFLQDGSKGLAQLVRASLVVDSNVSKLSDRDRPRLLLVIDQFEEAFSLAQNSHIDQERKQFFDCLLGAMEIVSDYLSVVIVLRSDFLTKCSLYEGLVQKIEQHQFVVPPLKYEQIKATIIRPAQKVGLVCEPSLIYTMLFDVSGAPGELPLLQYTLLELWQHRRIGSSGAVARLTLEAYQQLGGIRGTLQKRATEVFFSLSEREQTVAKRIFLALTQLGEGTEDTRRRVARSELVSSAYPVEQVEQVLEKLVAAKLIITNPEVDVIHEALIRNWPLLRTWLGENREMLRRLRRIEQSAQEWNNLGQSLIGEYLLSGLRLRDAEDFLRSYPQELSTLAQQFIAASHQESRRARRESRQLQVAVPSFLVATLAIVFSQYYSAVQSHAEKDRQLQLITTRERAAIAQSILQADDSVPEAALLVSRVAAEQGGASLNTQSSLRTALQNMRLQLELRGHTSAIHQLTFSPDRRFLASAGADGIVRLWALNAQQIYTTNLEPARILQWSTPDSDLFSNFNNKETDQCPDPSPDPSSDPNCTQMNVAAADIIALAFSPDGDRLAAIAKDSPLITLWSINSGAVIQQMIGSTAVTQIRFSPDGAWVATAHTDRSITIWQANTGQLMTRIPTNDLVRTIQFTANSQQLMVAVENAVHLWSLKPDPSTHTLKLDQAIALPHAATVNQATVSPKGRWIATASSDGVARLWDAATGRLLQTFVPQSQHATAAEQDVVSAVIPASHSQMLPDAPRSLLLSLQAYLPAPEPSTIASAQTSANVVTPILQAQFSPNEQTLAVADAHHQIWLWDIASGQIRDKLSIASTEIGPFSTSSSDISSSDISSPEKGTVEPALNLTNHFLVSTNSNANSDGSYSAFLWDIETGDRVGNLSGHQGMIEAAQFTPDGSYVVTAGADGVIRLWTTEVGELPTLSLPEHPIAWAMFIDENKQPPTNETLTSRQALEIESTSPSQQFASNSDPAATPIADLVTATPEGQLHHWQIVGDSPTDLPSLPSSSEQQRATAWVSDSQPFWQRLLTLLREPLHKFAPVAANPARPLEPFNPPRSTSEPVRFPPQLSLVNEVAVHAVPVETTVTHTQRSLSSMALGPNGQVIATATPTGQVNIYKVQASQSTQLIHQIQNWRSSPHGTAPLSELTWSSPSTPMFVASPSTSASGGVVPLGVTQNQGDTVTIRQLSFSPDQHLLLGIGDDFTIRLWDVQSGQLLQVLQGHKAAVQQARFSLDGERVVTASWDRTVRIWQVTSGQLLQTLSLPDAISISSASFNSDGQRVVTAGGDGMARVFQISTGEQQLLLRGHQQAVVDAQFSPDGTQIVTAGADGIVYLWDAQTGATQAELSSHSRSSSHESSPILQVSFSPDGQYIAALTKDGKVHLWAATWDMLLNLARNRSFRQLTPEECDRYLNLPSDQCPVLSLRNGE